MNFMSDSRFEGIKPFQTKCWLSSPTMHGDEQHWVDEAIQTNWVSTVGENIDAIEKMTAEKIGRKYSVALSNGTAALHLAIRLAGERLYGSQPVNKGVLEGRKVFCSDTTFDATVNPVAYEGGEQIFIDTELDSWNMSPEALEKAFQIYPDVKLIVLAHLYGTPGRCDEIRAIADKYGALIVEDAAESFGATYRGVQTGCFGDYSVISFNGNKIITGSAGGMLLTDNLSDADKARKWSTQSREEAAWYQHEELGYNYRMSNVIAGVVRGQFPYLEEHINQKKMIYERYKEKLGDLPVSMNPIPDCCEPNYWLSCLLIDKDAMCETVRGEKDALFISAPGKSCPTEILAAIAAFNAEGRPIWKPMHLQPIYRNNVFITANGINRGRSNVYMDEEKIVDVGADLFNRGLCLPSDNKMTVEQQNVVIEIIHRCFL
ncbi:MAG: DegT/DnrJ/EryC1/StrS family aminotransferase [Lachnospiraceae bacterium]